MPRNRQTTAEQPPLTEEQVTEIGMEAMPDADEPAFAAAVAAASKPTRRGKSVGGGGGRAPARVATPKELASVLAKLIGASSDVTAWLVGVDDVSMSPAEAGAIAEPAARILARSGLGKLLTKRLASSSDAIDLVLALVVYGSRVAPAVRAKMEQSNHVARKQVARPAGSGASAQPGSAGGGDAAGIPQQPIPQFDALAAGFAVGLG